MKSYYSKTMLLRTILATLSVMIGGLFGLSTQAEMAVMLDEDFSSCAHSGGHSWTTIGAAGGSQLSGFSTTVLPGWTGESVYGAFATNSVGTTNRMVKLGATRALGWIQTPPINLSGGNGDFTVTFRAGAWNALGEQTDIYVYHDTTSGSERIAVASLSKLEVQGYTIHGTNGTANSSIRIVARYTNDNRFFLDDVCVMAEPLTVDISTADVVSTVFAGQTASAVVTATDLQSGNPISVAVEETNIPQGNPYVFDGANFSWVPQVTGEYSVRFVSSNAVDSISCIMMITVSLPDPQAPVIEASAGTIRLAWEPVPGATGYSVQAYQLATEVELLAEKFQECTDMRGASATLIGAAGGNVISNRLSEVGLTGWSGYSVYCAFASNVVNNATNYMVKFSSYGNSAYGWLQTPPLDLSSSDGSCTLTFHAAKWAGDKGNLDVLHITENGETTNVLKSITGLSETTLTKHTVTVTNGTANSVICFTVPPSSTGNNRFFLDDVRLFDVVAARLDVPQSQITVNGTTARVSGLLPLSEYLCTVTATDGTAETVSPEIIIRTTASTLIILR